MAIIDKNGNIRGAAGGMVYRVLGSKNIMQGKPDYINQTAATKSRALEFGLASNTALSIRTTLIELYDGCDGKMVNRLQTLVRKAIAASEGEEPGWRDLHDGDISYLSAFQFNENSRTDMMLKVRPVVSFEKDNFLKISIPEIAGRTALVYPKSLVTVNCSLRISLISFNFRKEYYEYIGGSLIDIDSKGLAPFDLTFDCYREESELMFLCFSLHYYILNPQGGRKNLNSHECSPAEILAAWKTEARSEPDLERTALQSAGTGRLPLPAYQGNEILKNYQSDSSIEI